MHSLAQGPSLTSRTLTRSRTGHAMALLGLLLPLFSTVATTTGCYFSDQELPATAGGSCEQERMRQGELLCRQGVWVEDTTITPMDMGTPDATMNPSDQGGMPPTDMGRDTGCVSETVEEICQTLGRCGVTLSISDRCNMVRDVECPRSACPTDMLCNEAAGVCEAICEPQPCPPGIMCGLEPDGCGNMQVCDTCSAGLACDPETSMCTCDEQAIQQALCAGRCGTVPNTMSDTCFPERPMWTCPSCETGACNLATSMCTMLSVLPQPQPRQAERFGASLSLDGNFMMVGAPGQQTAYYGNAYIYDVKDGGDPLDVRQSIDLGVSYEGYVLGASVAMNRSTLALPGKVIAPRGVMGNDLSLSLIVRIGGTWQRSTKLDGTDASAGTTVATARNYFVVASPKANSRAGEVMLYTLDTSTQATTYSRAFKGSLEAELGSAMAMTTTQLLLGAPGARTGRGECRVARVKPDLVEWDNPVTLPAQSGDMLEAMCRAVALSPNLAAVSARRLIPSSTLGVDIVQLYTSNDNGASWSFAQEIENPGKRDDGSFGQAILFSHDKTYLFIGDPLLEASGQPQAGGVHIYKQNNASQYELIDTIYSNTPRASGHFGQALAASTTQLYIGAPDEPTMGLDQAGAIYIYSLP